VLARRALLCAFLLVLAVPAGGSGHGGHDGFVSVSIGGFKFDPSEAVIYTNEEVLWSWAGPDRQHTVTADAGQAEAFDSSPNGTPGPTGPAEGQGFSHVFRTAGTYTYHCKVHPSMRGSVLVKETPPPSSLPRVDGLRAAARARTRVTLRFSLSEPAVVLVEVERLPAGRLVLSRSRSMPAGPGALPINLRSLKRGSYRVQVVPVDAESNAGQPAAVRVKIVR
jgi:plastocyanin